MKNKWNLITTVLGVLVVLITFYYANKENSQRLKRLDVDLISKTTLVNTNLSSDEEGLEVLYNGRRINNFSIYQFRISNSGGQPIRNTDFNTDIQILFKNINEILSSDILERYPSDLNINLNSTTESVSIGKTLINSGDWFIIEIGFVPSLEYIPTIEVLGRITGIHEIHYTDETVQIDNTGSIYVQLYLVLIICFVSISNIILFIGFRREKERIK